MDSLPLGNVKDMESPEGYYTLTFTLLYDYIYVTVIVNKIQPVDACTCSHKPSHSTSPSPPLCLISKTGPVSFNPSLSTTCACDCPHGEGRESKESPRLKARGKEGTKDSGNIPGDSKNPALSIRLSKPCKAEYIDCIPTKTT